MEQEMESAGRLRVANTSLEVTNGKLEAELEETKRRLLAALSKPITEGADGKTWKASVVTRSAVRSASCFIGSDQIVALGGERCGVRGGDHTWSDDAEL